MRLPPNRLFGRREIAAMLFALEPEDLERFAIPIGLGIAALLVLSGPIS